MSSLPDGWSWSTIDELTGGLRSNSIIGPFGSNLKVSDYTSRGVPLVFVRDIRSGTFTADGPKITLEKAASLQGHDVRMGDLLVTKMGDPPGDSAIYTRAETGIITADCIRLRLSADYEPRFVAYAFRTEIVRRQIDSITRGAAQRKVSLDRLRASVRVPAPLIKEQRRIANILDRADAARSKRREALAVLGDLTRSIFLEMFGDPRSPHADGASLIDLCHAYSGGTPSKSRPELWNGDLPWFSPKDLKAPELDDSMDHISEAVPATTSLRLLPVGTVLMVVRGMILSHTVPVAVTTVPATINQDLKGFLPREPIDPFFLLWAIRAQHDAILSAVSTAAHGTKRLDAQALGAITIPRPGPAREGQFSERALHVRSQLHRLTLAALDADKLFQSVLQQAFAGLL